LKIPLLNEKLQTYYKKLDLPSSDFLQLIKIMIHFIGDGTKLLQEDRVEESFINLWIALDTVLNNDTEAKSNELKNRVAALSWYQYKTNQSNQYDFVNTLYKKRSAYIHSGVTIAREDALSLNKIAQTILDDLLRIHAYSSKIKSISYNEWINNVDIIIDLSYKGAEIGKDLLETTGIVAFE
jgi:hypothetical protein